MEDNNIYLKIVNNKLLSFLGIHSLLQITKSKNYDMMLTMDEWNEKGGAVYLDSSNNITFTDPYATKKAALKEIDLLKKYLNNTDYAIIKISEGVATKEDYASIIEQRKQWRNRINELEVYAQ